MALGVEVACRAQSWLLDKDPTELSLEYPVGLKELIRENPHAFLGPCTLDTCLTSPFTQGHGTVMEC